jgi:transcriptional regulator with XRE-family HTH domain
MLRLTMFAATVVSMSDRPRIVKPPGELIHDRRRLKGHRMMARLTLRQAAAAAEMSPGHLSDLEHGYKSAGPGSLGRLADVYGCEVKDLLPPDAGGTRRTRRTRRTTPRAKAA